MPEDVVIAVLAAGVATGFALLMAAVAIKERERDGLALLCFLVGWLLLGGCSFALGEVIN